MAMRFSSENGQAHLEGMSDGEYRNKNVVHIGDDGMLAMIAKEEQADENAY